MASLPTVFPTNAGRFDKLRARPIQVVDYEVFPNAKSAEHGRHRVGATDGPSEPGRHRVGPTDGLSEPGRQRVGATDGLSEPGRHRVGATDGLSERGRHWVGATDGPSEPAGTRPALQLACRNGSSRHTCYPNVTALSRRTA